MTDDVKKNCEAYFRLEEQEMKDGVNAKSKSITIQGIGDTPEQAFDLFKRVKSEMVDKK